MIFFNTFSKPTGIVLLNKVGSSSGLKIGFWCFLYVVVNHLGNVLAVVSDRKIAVDAANDGTADYFTGEVLSANDYYAFGATMPGRNFTSSSYRYGFNGKENDKEANGNGGTQDYGLRIYNPSLGKFLSVDPLTKSYPELTPYQFASNTPINSVDLDGGEAKVSIVHLSDGNGNYDPKMGRLDEFKLYSKTAANVAMMSRLEDYSNSIVTIHTGPDGIEAISYTYINAKKELETFTVSDGILIGINEVKAEKEIEQEEKIRAAIEVWISHEGKRSGKGSNGNWKNGKLNPKTPVEPTATALGGPKDVREFASKRAAMRQAKRDAGIPTSQTHNTHTKVKADRFDNAKSGTEYKFDGDKTIQNHPNGHPNQGVDQSHFNNHQPAGQTGGTKNHYVYPKKNS